MFSRCLKRGVGEPFSIAANENSRKPGLLGPFPFCIFFFFSNSFFLVTFWLQACIPVSLWTFTWETLLPLPHPPMGSELLIPVRICASFQPCVFFCTVAAGGPAPRGGWCEDFATVDTFVCRLLRRHRYYTRLVIVASTERWL